MHIHAASDGTYGVRRVHAELRLEHGIHVARKRVERLIASRRYLGGDAAQGADARPSACPGCASCLT